MLAAAALAPVAQQVAVGLKSSIATAATQQQQASMAATTTRGPTSSPEETNSAASDYASASPSCISAFEYYHNLTNMQVSSNNCPAASRRVMSSITTISSSSSSSSSLSSSSSCSPFSPPTSSSASYFCLSARRRHRNNIKKLLRSDSSGGAEPEAEQRAIGSERQSGKELTLETNEKFALLDFNSSDRISNISTANSLKRTHFYEEEEGDEDCQLDEYQISLQRGNERCSRRRKYSHQNQSELKGSSSTTNNPAPDGSKAKGQQQPLQAAEPQRKQQAAAGPSGSVFSESERKELQRQQQHYKIISIGGNSVEPDPVYLDDKSVFENLILREKVEEKRALAGAAKHEEWAPALSGQLRHSLLSWMLRVCEHQLCQDEIFPLATMIMDKFLQFHPIVSAPEVDFNAKHRLANEKMQNNSACLWFYESNSVAGGDEDSSSLHCEEQWTQLKQRQLCLFAACSLLLATKLRQTPRLYVHTLIEFSRLELPIELSREEILDGELLILATLKWDLASLVTPNDYLAILTRKCSRVAATFLATTSANSSSSSSTSDGYSSGEEISSSQTTENNSDQFPAQANNEKQTLRRRRRRQQHSREQLAATTAATRVTTTTSIGRQQESAPNGEQAATDEEGQEESGNMRHRLRLNRCDESRVRRHTQTLLELCLMGEYCSLSLVLIKLVHFSPLSALECSRVPLHGLLATPLDRVD